MTCFLFNFIIPHSKELFQHFRHVHLSNTYNHTAQTSLIMLDRMTVRRDLKTWMLSLSWILWSFCFLGSTLCYHNITPIMITTQQQYFNADPIIDNEPSLDCMLIPNNTQKSNFYLYKSIGDIFFNTMAGRHEKSSKFSFQKYIIIRIFHKYYITRVAQ